MYADYIQVKIQVNELVNECKFSKMISDMFTNVSSISAKQTALLRQRNRLLLTVFKDGADSIQLENDLIVLDCATNANYIIPKVLPPNLYSYSRKKQCNRCNRNVVSNRCFVDINFEEYDKSGISNLNRCLLISLITEKPSICSSHTCDGSEVLVQTEFSSFIVIDLQLKQAIKNIALKEIPKTLNILGIHFSLTGCMEFIGDVDELICANKNEDKRVGHYISHLYRSNNCWKMYDDMKAMVVRSDTKSKIQGQVLFYVKNITE